MGEICDGMPTMAGNHNYLSIEKSSAKSTAGDGLRGRDNEFFKDTYFILETHFKTTLSVSWIDNVSFSKLFILDK